VRARLERLHPGLEVQLVKMSTEGDKILDTPLAKIGGKGLFLKELEQALLEKHVDIAVHSLKDVTVNLPPGLVIPVIGEREDPRDAFVSNQYSSLDTLPAGSRVGTSSLRRECQVRAQFPNLEIVSLRGNVNTRLAKLDNKNFDAILLAAAGLKRLGFESRIASLLPPEVMLPAVGQGALAIECREDDRDAIDLIAPLHHPETAACVQAERALNERLEGGCQVPIAAYSQITGGQIRLRALVGSPDGKHVIRGETTGKIDNVRQLGRDLADELLGRGAGGILDQVYGRR